MATVASRIYTLIARALVGVGIVVRTSASSVVANDPTISSGSGVPAESEPNGSFYLRTNGTPYVRSGGAWAAISGNGTITDGSTWYTADTLQGVADGVVAAVGGTSQGVRNYTGGYVVTDNQTVFASIDALDGAFGAALSTLTTTSKTLVGSINEVDADVLVLNPAEVADPGNAGAIPITRSGVVPIVTAGAETRTLADPTRVGLQLTLFMLTDGGDAVVATASPVNATGNNRVTFANAGELIQFVSVRDGGGTFAWRVTGKDGVALSTV